MTTHLGFCLPPTSGFCLIISPGFLVSMNSRVAEIECVLLVHFLCIKNNNPHDIDCESSFVATLHFFSMSNKVDLVANNSSAFVRIDAQTSSTLTDEGNW